MKIENDLINVCDLAVKKFDKCLGDMELESQLLLGFALERKQS